MNFSVYTILISLVFSGVGWVYFSYGKRMNKLEIIIVGVILMVYGYFVESVPISIGIGAALSAAPFVMKWW